MDQFEEIRFPGDEAKHLPEGWWRFRLYLCHGAQSRMEAIATAGITPQQLLDGAGASTPVDIVAVNNAMILGSTTEWSFGPVTQAVFDGIPGVYAKEVLAKMDDLYGESPLAGEDTAKSNGSQKGSSSPSPVAASPQSS